MRYQGDEQQEMLSKASQIDCSEPVLVRPEFGPESDIRTILRRHGAIPAATRQAMFTETDFDTDLTSALSQLRRAHAAFDELPQKHREKYRTADELWAAYRSGKLRDDEELSEKINTEVTVKEPLAAGG